MLYISNIYKSYYGKNILSNISFHIQKGRILGLLGSNGAGKTTIIRLLTGLILPDSGEIIFEQKKGGRPIHECNLGYLPEERGLYKNMSVQDHLIYLALMKGLTYKQAKKKTLQWLDKFDILDWKKRKIGQLSKGMQQKIQFIGAIIHEPELLILDEPFSGLDPITTKEIGLIIKEEQVRGCTIILSSHNMNSVEEFCDNVVLINKGQVILYGQITDIKEAYKENVFELCFEQENAAFVEQLSKIGVLISNCYKGNLFYIRIHTECKKKLDSIIAQYIHLISLKSYNEVLPGLDEIFINIIKNNDHV